MKLIPLISIGFLSVSVAAQDFAIRQLENSPRHHEWVNVISGDRPVHCFVVYPEIAEKTLAVIVIHENKGLTPWVRSLADQLAEAGYIAVAPDLLSGFSEEFQSTSDFPNMDEARNAIYQLDPEQVKKDLLVVREYASGIEASNGKTAVMGFCWGGSQAFRFATYNDQVEACLVFYGGAPESQEAINSIAVPVYGFYGGNDNRVNAGIPDTEKMMKKAGKTYEYVIYPEAGHGFMRQGDDPEGSAENKVARDAAWERIRKILGAL